eukprot:CAMPEP_0202686224 /NCGR_PEP_ID=MMETSP1385-20130828/2031_1 /ASSEMBLY_ACC=CAM_ASM_000861 /TAXON_ID=933848 /ORGANISM="Elphidium margaritaceum" /LENGTH=194 /DNA_ID=CAMNT_0049340755 /DNA_START=170 /DNA_END=754 /DNA_ORIENTATION=+
MANSNSRLLLQGSAPIVNPVNFGSLPADPSSTVPPLPTIAVPTTELICDIPRRLADTCALTTQTPEHLAPFFELHCATPEGCYGTTFNLFYGEYGVTPAAGVAAPTELEALSFTEANAGAYATVNLYNFFPGNQLKANRIECKDVNACYGLKLNLYNVDIGDFICDPLTACTDCTITDWTNPLAAVTTTCLDLV